MAWELYGGLLYFCYKKLLPVVVFNVFKKNKSPGTHIYIGDGNEHLRISLCEFKFGLSWNWVSFNL